MENLRLIKLLKTFSPQEMKDFEKFVASPYFSKGRNLKPLFSIVKKYYPEFKSPNFTQENVFKKLFPGKKYEGKKSAHALSVFISELTLLSEKFLAFEHIQKSSDGYMLHESLSLILLIRNFLEQSNKHRIDNIKRIQNNAGVRGLFTEMTETISDIQYVLMLMNKEKEGYDYSKKIPLYFYGYVLSGLTKLVNDYILYPYAQENNPMSKELLKMGIESFKADIFERECYDDGLGTKQFVLFLYYVLMAQLNKDDEKSFENALDFLKTNIKSFKPSIKWAATIMTINICLQRMRESDLKTYSHYGSDIVDIAVENNFFSFTITNSMRKTVFISFFHIKIHLMDGELLKGYITKLLEKVSEGDRNELYGYSQAWLNFKSKKYNKTLEFISKLSNLSAQIKTYVNMLKISSYYSLGHIEDAIYNIDSFEHFIRNNSTISERNRKEIRLFITSVNLLIKLRTKSQKTDEYILSQLIIDNRLSFFYDWFIEETERLKK